MREERFILAHRFHSGMIGWFQNRKSMVERYDGVKLLISWPQESGESEEEQGTRIRLPGCASGDLPPGRPHLLTAYLATALISGQIHS